MFDLLSRALCSWAAREPRSGPSELDERDILGTGGGGGGGGPDATGKGEVFHGRGGQGGAGGAGGGGAARDIGGGWGAGGAEEVLWWPGGVAGIGGPCGELALGLLITKTKYKLNEQV